MSMSKMSIVVTSLLLLSTGCRTDSPSPFGASEAGVSTPRQLLRSYQFPVGHEKEVERLLREVAVPISVVSAAGVNTRFVPLRPQIVGQGQVLLSAPEGIQEGVPDLLQTIGRAPPRPPAKTIEVTYWLVLGWPGTEVSLAPGLSEVEKPLKALAEIGVKRFALLERIQVASLENIESKTHGRYATEIIHVASAEGDQIGLDLRPKCHTTPTRQHLALLWLGHVNGRCLTLLFSG